MLDAFFLTAARTLAVLVTAQDREKGTLHAPRRDIRRISLAIATSVAEGRPQAWAMLAVDVVWTCRGPPFRNRANGR
jgi:hypothetical protein